MTGARGGVRVGRIFGIDIAIDTSWVFIALLMGRSLTNAFGRWHPDCHLATVLVTAIVATLLFFLSVVLHELAHSLVAKRFGVPVDRITLFLFGGVSNIEQEPPSAFAEFLTAAVGPLTSIVLGVLLIAIGSAAITLPADVIREPIADLSSLSPVESLLLWLGPINIVVGVFNLIPGFPLDGGRILRAAIWGVTKDLHLATWWASAVGQAIGWGLVFVGVAMVFGAHVPLLGGGVVGGLWLAFIGWFLSSAATQTRRRQLVHDVLEGVSVSRLALPPGPAVPPHLDLDSLVGDWMTRSGERGVPGRRRPRRARRARHLRRSASGASRRVEAHAEVAQVMTPRGELVTTGPRDDLADAAEKLAQADVGQLPVLDRDQTLVGQLLRRDVLRWIELHIHQGTRGYAH